MKFLLNVTVAIFFGCITNSHGQSATEHRFLESIFFETDLVTKISTGSVSRKTILYAPGITANIPQKSRFRNPVIGLNVSLNYKLNRYISTGLGSGIHIAKFEYHPIIPNEQIDRIFFPAFIRLTYLQEISNNYFLLCDLNTGYQFYDLNHGNTIDGFYYNESGGMMYNASLGIGKNINTYSAVFTIGYEVNHFSNNASLGGLGVPGLAFSEKIYYKTLYHMFRLGLGIKV